MNRAEEVWEKALDAGFAEQERGRDGTDAAVAVIATVLAESRAQGVREMRDELFGCVKQLRHMRGGTKIETLKLLGAVATRLLSSAPPEQETPNEVTRQAMQEMERGETTIYPDVDSFFRSLKDDPEEAPR